jgi:hypothetical protein
VPNATAILREHKIRGVTWPALWKARKLELVSH